MPPKDVCVLLCTVPKGEADKIAATLVDRRLAACVNIVGDIQSVYRWDGEVTQDSECLLIIKTIRDMADRLREQLVELHSYEVPEVLVLDVQDGHIPYLEWIRSSVESEKK